MVMKVGKILLLVVTFSLAKRSRRTMRSQSGEVEEDSAQAGRRRRRTPAPTPAPYLEEKKEHLEAKKEHLVDFGNDLTGFDLTNFGYKGYQNKAGHCKVLTGCKPQEPTLPFLVGDCNPIGFGNIHGAYGLLVMIFGNSSGIRVDDLKRIVYDRRFPADYVFKGTFRGSRVPATRGLTGTQMPNVFVRAKKSNFRLIICPFLSTLVNEGVLPVQQLYTRQLLQEVTIEAGLEQGESDEHVGENFANNGNGEDFGNRDIFNMEGITNEHLQSTGINDCETEFVECVDRTDSFGIGVAERPFERCVSVRSQCELPNFERWHMLVDAVNINRDPFITTDELDDAARRTCTFGKPSAR